jgi:hypothetical protein
MSGESQAWRVFAPAAPNLLIHVGRRPGMMVM